jgi:PAS domain S-box-containing protein
VAESAHKFATLFQKGASAAVFSRLPAGSIVDVNEAWERDFGYSKEAVIGKTSLDLKMISPGTRERIKNELIRQEFLRDVEMTLRTKSGEERVFLGSLDLLKIDGQEYVLSTYRDITESKQIEKERAEEARLKDEFLALLGHELRNPLAAISTAVHLLSGELSAEQRAALTEMTGRQVALMRRLLDDLLDLERIAHGHLQLETERTDFGEFLQKEIAAMQPTAAKRGQQLVLRLPPEPVTFMADRARLEQIVGNLLSNASKYTPKGGWIEFSGAREGSEVVFRCKDNGRGIPPESQRKIFEPFIRGAVGVDDYGQASLGLGLALAKQVTELHGGTISVESAGVGKGSEFTVRLPLVVPPPEKPVTVKSVWDGSRSVAVVDDNPNLTMAMKVALEQAGHRVTIFDDGPSALSGIGELSPDVVLLDVGLPGMDGYEVLAKMKEQRNLRNTLFIGISGFKRRPQTEKSRGDFDHYLVKPVNVQELFSLFAKHPQPVETERPNARPESEDIGPARVLLVEDHPGLAAMTARLLNDENLEVHTALTGGQALEAASRFQPQLVLCDMNLPDMNGLEVIRGLRSSPATSAAYTVILTALTQSELQTYNTQAKELGVDEFIPKPITLDVVRPLVSKLKRHAARAT